MLLWHCPQAEATGPSDISPAPVCGECAWESAWALPCVLFVCCLVWTLCGQGNESSECWPALHSGFARVEKGRRQKRL